MIHALFLSSNCGSISLMKKLLTTPSNMSLSAGETTIYQKILLEVAPLSLNLMAVKVTDHPQDFNGWCTHLLDVCLHKINRDLMDEAQFKPLKKMSQLLATGISISQIKMATVVPWELYQENLLAKADSQSMDERLRLLNYIASLEVTGLAGLINEDRLAFVGKHGSSHDPKVYDFDVQWFGNTKTAKSFHQLLSVNSGAFDNALAAIPSTGKVTKEHYEAFIEEFVTQMTNIDEKSTLPVATRLLAMRRPDQFMAITSAKIDELCQGLGIPKFKINDFNSYWDDVIRNIHSTKWFKTEKPLDEKQQVLWRNRVVLMDVLFWADEGQAKKSNYLTLLNKPARKSGKATNVRRSKESATELVDRVLAFDDTPEFIKDQRSSIISQVEAGKKIEDVINLLTKIFGY
jgi:hypothetical protein